jgi:TolB-like protein
MDPRDPGLDPATWGRARDIFADVLERPAEEWAAALDVACAGEPALRAEIHSLLHAHLGAGEFLESLDPVAAAALTRAVEPGLIPEDRVGPYRIIRRLGQGGMGVVYLARDARLDRTVALKFLAPYDFADEGTATRRLLQEARAAAALDHPNIAVVHEIGETEAGQIFIVMAHYDGETVRQKLERGPLLIDEALRLVRQLAEGLAAVHGRGIIHRDIKPGNIIVTEDGTPKILDFGISRLEAGSDVTREAAVPGTAAYMSPEQTRGGPTDARSDIWSLGVVLYEMLAGERPFRSEGEAGVMQAIRHDPPAPLTTVRPAVPASVAAIIRTCLAKDPDDRYLAAEELLADLRAVEADLKPAAMPRARHKRRHLQAVAGLTLGLLILTVTSMLVLRAGRSGGEASLDGLGGAEVWDSASILVLPFAPAVQDSALERLGRDLVVTISAGLDGIEHLQTVDAATVLAQPTPAAGAFSVIDGAALARRLGVGRLLHGALIRAGDRVRLEAALYAAAEGVLLARVSVTEDPHDLTALSDAAALALLRELWKQAPPAAPSITAITTTSVAALRAYLDAEHALASGDMVQAVASFERAHAADSTFWYAYLRSLYPRVYAEASSPADTTVLRRALESRAALPVADRLLAESWLAPTRTERKELLERLTDRFRHHFPGSWEYANFLCHHGPYFGTTYEDARDALQLALELNPDFSPAWQHLAVAAIAIGDTATAEKAAQELVRTSSRVAARQPAVRSTLLRVEALRSGLQDPDSLRHAVEVLLAAPPGMALSASSGFIADGLPEAQIRINRALRERRPSRDLAGALQRGEALAWAARGAWDSALVAMDRWARMSGEPPAALDAYRLAVAGVALDVVPSIEAEARRPVRSAPALEWAAGDVEELVWLDGVLGYVQGDRSRILRAVDALRAGSDARTSLLQRSLEALAYDAAGDRDAGLHILLELDRLIADRWNVHAIGGHHPLLISLNRIFLARWLRDLGRAPEAARLLTWTDAGPGPPVLLHAWARSIGGLSLLERGELAEAMDRPEQARVYYARFLAQHDLPVPALRPNVERARAGLARSSPSLPRGQES